MSFDRTTKIEDFNIFMFNIRAYLDKWENQKMRLVTAAIDNTIIRQTKQAKSLWMSFGIELMGLTQYCSHLAPVELVFGMTKKILARKAKLKW